MSRRPILSRLLRRASAARGLAILAIAAFVVSPLGAQSVDGLLPSDASTALAAQNIELAPAPQVTDPSALAPTVNKEPRAGALAVDTADRQAVVNLFNSVYTPALQVQNAWTGSIAGCNPGTSSAAFDTATITMVNYFRAMAGLPDSVTLDTARSISDEQAALMLIANGVPTRFLPPGSLCYTASGAAELQTANLALGVAGAAAVVGYVQDPGTGNEAVPHRRWILYPPQVSMGTGSTTATSPNGAFTGSNALGVTNGFGVRPPTPAYVAWPPAGFVPYQIVYPRWSFSYQNADFSAATVTMTQGTTNIPVILDPQQQGFGDNTISWEPQVTFTTAPATDTPYTVNLTNVRINGAPQNFTYTVTVINPGTAGGGAIGGKGLGISSGPAGVQLTWSTGSGQTGYNVLRLANNALTVANNTPLAASATSFLDATPPPGLDCYALLPLGTNPQQISDIECALVGFHTITGSPQNFTLRLNQSSTASLTWTAPTNTSFDGYLLVKFGDGTQALGPTITSTLGAANGLTCWALAATLGGNIVGYTDFECGLPGASTLNP